MYLTLNGNDNCTAIAPRPCNGLPMLRRGLEVVGLIIIIIINRCCRVCGSRIGLHLHQRRCITHTRWRDPSIDGSFRDLWLSFFCLWSAAVQCCGWQCTIFCCSCNCCCCCCCCCCGGGGSCSSSCILPENKRVSMYWWNQWLLCQSGMCAIDNTFVNSLRRKWSSHWINLLPLVTATNSIKNCLLKCQSKLLVLSCYFLFLFISFIISQMFI